MAYAPRTAELTINADPPAWRLKFRKGEIVRINTDGSSWQDYRITGVSMPDELGNCCVGLEEAVV